MDVAIDYEFQYFKKTRQARINMKLEKDIMKIVEEYVKGLKKHIMIMREKRA